MFPSYRNQSVDLVVKRLTPTLQPLSFSPKLLKWSWINIFHCPTIFQEILFGLGLLSHRNHQFYLHCKSIDQFLYGESFLEEGISEQTLVLLFYFRQIFYVAGLSVGVNVRSIYCLVGRMSARAIIYRAPVRGLLSGQVTVQSSYCPVGLLSFG